MDDFFDQRRKALGLTSGDNSEVSSNDFFQRRRMELGLIPDTRPTPSQQFQQQFGGVFPSFDASQTPLMQGASGHGSLPNMNPVTPQPQPQQQQQQVQEQEQPQNGDFRTDYPGGFFNPLNDLGYLANSAPVRLFDYAAGKAMGVPDNMMNAPKSTGSDLADKAIEYAGGTAGFLTNPTMPVGTLPTGPLSNFYEHPKLQQIAQSAGNKVQSWLPDAGLTVSRDGTQIVDSMLGKTLNDGVTGAIQVGLGGVAYAPFHTLTTGGDVQDIPKDMLDLGLQGALLGGVLGAASPAVGQALRTLMQRKGIVDTSLTPGGVFDEAAGARNERSAGGNVNTSAQDELANRFNFIDRNVNGSDNLALPPSAQELRLNEIQQNRQQPAVGSDPIAQPGDVRTYALPEPDIAPPSTARAAANPWRVKFENLINVANQMEHPPGRELESLEDLWSRMAGPNDPNLSDLVDLAYPRSKVTPDALQRARQQQYEREVAGVSGPVKTMADRYNGGVKGEAAAPVAERFAKVSTETPPQIEITPPKRKFATSEAAARQGGVMPGENGKTRALRAPALSHGDNASDGLVYRTSKGSTYTVDAQGRTIRNKSLHQGHDPKDVGAKPRSDATVYVDKNEAARIGSHFGMNKEARPKIVLRDDGIYLASWNPKENRWGLNGKPIPYTTMPEVGRSPVEFWKLNQDAELGTTASKVHAGNEITEIIPPKGNRPTSTDGLPERGVFTTLKESPNTQPETIGEIRNQGDTTYTPKSNTETLGNAEQSIINKGIEQSRRSILENPRALNDEETATAFRLLQHYQSQGDFESAAKIAHKLMTSGTENGRAVQINSIFSKLTPEGSVRFASKIVQDAAKDPKKTLTSEQARNITEAAQRLQKATINKQTTGDAIKIIGKLAEGEKITPAEADQLKQFAKLAERTVPKNVRQQYKDLQGNAPKEAATTQEAPQRPQEPRVRDKVTSFTTKQADAARARIRARKGQLNSLPLDEWADYAIIGADYIAKGTKTVADFAEKMADDVGQFTYAQANRLFVDSYNRFRRQNKQPMTDLEKIVNRAISTHGIGADEAYALKAKAIELAQLTGRDKEQAEGMLHQQFQELMEPGIGKKLASILRSAQLLNPRTTIRNVIANIMFYGLDTSLRRLSSVVDLAASKMTGTDRQIFWHNAPDIWKSYLSDVNYGAKEGFAGRNPGGFQTQYDFGNLAFDRYGNWGERIGSFMERSLGAVNKSFDYASANMAMKNELFQLAQAKAYAEGLRGAKLRDKAVDYFYTADDNMLEQAKEYGDYMTFQDKNFLSDSAQKIKSALNFGKDFGLGNILLNYPKTPANILMRAIDYSPAGYLKFAGNLAKMVLQKNVNKKTLIQDFVRASGGTAMGWLAYELTKAGLINVLPSQNKNVNSLERSAGIISNSVNVDGLIRYAKTLFSDPSVAKPRPGDYYASMDWAQPMAISASAGAAIAQAQDPSRLQSGVKAASAAVQSLEGSLESAGNMSVLGNIKQAIMGNSNNPNQTIMGRIGDVLAQVPLAFMPSFLNQIKNSIDPKVRDTNDEQYFSQVLKQMENRIPGLSNRLPQRYDTLGMPMQNQFGPAARAFNAFINPSLMGQYQPNPAAQTILNLINQTGDQTLAPSKPQQTMKIGQQNIKLSPDEYTNLQVQKGQLIQDYINQYMKMLNDPSLPVESRAQALKKLLDASSKVSNANMKAQKLMAK